MQHIVLLDFVVQWLISITKIKTIKHIIGKFIERTRRNNES